MRFFLNYQSIIKSFFFCPVVLHGNFAVATVLRSLTQNFLMSSASLINCSCIVNRAVPIILIIFQMINPDY